jgi:putative transposase
MYLTYDETLEINKPNKNKIEKHENVEKDRILSIDLGINNLMTIFSNVGPSFIVNGKPLKSYNQYYNKHIAKVKSQLKKVNNKYTSILTNRINENRNNYINDYLNKSVAIIKSYCLENGIGRVIIGYNELWKQNVNMGKKNNQKFVYIPHGRLRMKLEHKLVEAGIVVDMVEESYTSKCSFMDREKVCKHESYVGKRVKRGLFRTENGIFINSDVNGAGNIMRKLIDEKNVFLEKQFDKIVGSIISPVRFNLF